jgi:hypothetical protein
MPCTNKIHTSASVLLDLEERFVKRVRITFQNKIILKLVLIYEMFCLTDLFKNNPLLNFTKLGIWY